ncbi:MAG TPA: cell division protein FtsQ, partial [Pararhizobium sp.]|nr:cell division protein FtsQ [Pararhizobium sp.]
MSALNGREHRKGGHGESAGHVVLPRPLRRAARFAQALATGRTEFPRHLGVVSMLVMLGATGAYGMVLGGHTQATMEATTSAFGFAVNKVDIKGNVETSDIDVLQQLHLDGD